MFAGFNYEIAAHALNRGPLIGQGGCGSVYQGQWQGTNVAIKVLNSANLMTSEIATDFMQEIAIMLELKAPQIIRIFGAVLTPYQAIVMEFMPNGDLHKVLVRERDLDWSRKYQIASDVAYGIKYLHDRNIEHRDLKSLNVLLNEHYQAKISDFGLAKIKNTLRSYKSINRAMLVTNC